MSYLSQGILVPLQLNSLERVMGLEPTISCLGSKRSTVLPMASASGDSKNSQRKEVIEEFVFECVNRPTEECSGRRQDGQRF